MSVLTTSLGFTAGALLMSRKLKITGSLVGRKVKKVSNMKISILKCFAYLAAQKVSNSRGKTKVCGELAECEKRSLEECHE